MEYLYQNCEWEQDGLHTIPVISTDAKASCWMYSFHHEPDVVYFENLQVCPNARGEGRGKGILRFCEDMARRMGFYQISLKVRFMDAEMVCERGIYLQQSG